MINKAKEHGIVIYIDSVLNHKAAADATEVFKVVKVDPNDRTQVISDPYDIEGWTKFDFKERGDKYSAFRWTFDHFTGVDYDQRSGETAIYQIQGDNKGFALGVDGEKGNFDYLMFADIDHAHGDVVNDLNSWGEWVIKETGAAGFRFDAVKHIDHNFIAQFVKHVREFSGKPLFCVGEFWKGSCGRVW